MNNFIKKYVLISLLAGMAVVTPVFSQEEESDANLLKAALINQLDCFGKTPLYNAVLNEDVAFVRILLKNGADIKAVSYDKSNCGCRGKRNGLRCSGSLSVASLMVAAVKTHNLEIVRLLLEHGADVNGSANALMYACDKGDLEIVRLLLEYGADVNLKDYWGTNALKSACRQLNPEIVRLLLEHGADVNAQDSRGESALMYACNQGNPEIVRLLLDHGADVNLLTRKWYGLNALGKAYSMRSGTTKKEIVDLLVAHGAKWRNDSLVTTYGIVGALCLWLALSVYNNPADNTIKTA